MIDYSPFWETLKRSDENRYTLVNKHHVSSSTMYRLRHNENLNTKTINDLCRILNCEVSDIMKYIPSKKDQLL